MTEEKSLFKEDKRRNFYLKIIVLAKKMNLVFLYFCIVMNALVIGTMLFGDPNVGVVFFIMNIWFLIFLRWKMKKDKINV